MKNVTKTDILLGHPESMDISEDKPEAFSKALLKVEDIDENDKDNPQLVSEYVNDIYQYMKELEVGFISFLCLQFLKLLKIWTTVKEKLFGSSRMCKLCLNWIIFWNLHIEWSLLLKWIFRISSVWRWVLRLAFWSLFQKKYPVKSKFLEGYEITGKMRAILIDWLCQVHHRFHLLQETLYLTVSIIDRFLQVFKNLHAQISVKQM